MGDIFEPSPSLGTSPGTSSMHFGTTAKSVESGRVDSLPGGDWNIPPVDDSMRYVPSAGSSPGHPPLLPSLIAPVESGKASSGGWFVQNRYDKSDRTKGSKTAKSPQPFQNILERQVLLCPLDNVPGKEVKRYLGPLQLHFIKDAWTGRGDQSMEAFTYSFIEVANMNAMAHVSSLGGNALLCYKLVMQEPAHKLSSRSHSYILVSITGDVVSLGDTSQSPLGSPTLLSRHSSVGADAEVLPRSGLNVRAFSTGSYITPGIPQRERNASTGSMIVPTPSWDSSGVPRGQSQTQSLDFRDAVASLAAHSPSSAK